jgi:hypothetical protein
MFLPNTLTSSTQIRGWCVPFNSNPSWWHMLQQCWEAMVIKHLSVSDHFEHDMHETAFYLGSIYCRFV